MKNFKYLILSIIGAAGLIFSGCSKDEDSESKAVLPQESQVLLPGTASTKTITIYADGKWKADIDQTWFTISPTSGYGTVEVTLTAEANTEAGDREGKIFIVGASSLGEVDIKVTQRGDPYSSVAESSLADAAALPAGSKVRLAKSTVAAIINEGFVVTDGTTSMFVQKTPQTLLSLKDSSLAVGDHVIVTGDVAAFNGINSVSGYDVFYQSHGEVVYPETVDISSASGYAPSTVQYVTTTVSYGDGGALSNGETKVGYVFQPASSQVQTYAFHKVGITGFYIGTASDGLYYVLPVDIQDIEMEAVPLLVFEIGTDDFYNTYKDTYGATRSFPAKTGSGFIEYVPYDLDNTDPDGKFKMDIDQSGAHYDDPRCTGPWPEDYWLFESDAAVKANTEFNIKFGTRTSATGMKYWILEYLDGKVWKTAGTPKLSTDMPSQVEYTAAMNSDGWTNVIVNENFKITKNMDQLKVRFRCVANWQANGKGALAKRNGGSSRLSIRSNTSSPSPVTCPQPGIYMTKMGDGVESGEPDPVEAKLEVSTDLLTFEGTPAAPATFTVSSDQNFSLKSDASWLTLTPASGQAGTPSEISVTCEPSTLSSLRQAKITITSGLSTAVVNVVQSAAGGNLDPLISLSSGNSVSIPSEGGDFRVDVQANVSYDVQINGDWITPVPSPAVFSIVSTTSRAFSVGANTSGDNRTGTIRFYNTAHNLEAVLTVTQTPKGTIVFSDNFDWVAPFVQMDKDSGHKQGDSMKDKATVNIGSSYNLAGFVDAFTQKGYEALFPASKTIYVCEGNYLKFSKTSNVNGIRLPSVTLGASGNMIVSFDWGRNGGDVFNLVVEVEGNGTINGEKKVEYTNDEWTWKTESFMVKGADADTRVIVHPTDYTGAVSKTKILHRWFLDNVQIEVL